MRLDPPPYRSVEAKVVYQDGNIAVTRVTIRVGGDKRDEYRVACVPTASVQIESLSGEARTTGPITGIVPTTSPTMVPLAVT